MLKLRAARRGHGTARCRADFHLSSRTYVSAIGVSSVLDLIVMVSGPGPTSTVVERSIPAISGGAAKLTNSVDPCRCQLPMAWISRPENLAIKVPSGLNSTVSSLAQEIPPPWSTMKYAGHGFDSSATRRVVCRQCPMTAELSEFDEDRVALMQPNAKWTTSKAVITNAMCRGPISSINWFSSSS